MLASRAGIADKEVQRGRHFDADLAQGTMLNTIGGFWLETTGWGSRCCLESRQRHGVHRIYVHMKGVSFQLAV